MPTRRAHGAWVSLILAFVVSIGGFLRYARFTAGLYFASYAWNAIAVLRARRLVRFSKRHLGNEHPLIDPARCIPPDVNPRALER